MFIFFLLKLKRKKMQNLSNDVFLYILSFLDPIDFLLGFNSSCKRFNQICQNKELLWKLIGEKKYPSFFFFFFSLFQIQLFWCRWFKMGLEQNKMNAKDYFKQLYTLNMTTWKGPEGNNLEGYTITKSITNELTIKFNSRDSLCLSNRPLGEEERCYWEYYHEGATSSRLGICELKKAQKISYLGDLWQIGYAITDWVFLFIFFLKIFFFIFFPIFFLNFTL